MVKAEIKIETCYGDAIIPVEVLGAGPQTGTAWVRALNGLEPFTKISSGGPYQDHTSVVFISHLRGVCIENENNPKQLEEPALKDGTGLQSPDFHPCVPADWFLEYLYEDRTCCD